MLRRLTLFMACILVGCFATSGVHLAHLFQCEQPGEPSPRATAIAHYLTGIIYDRDGRLEEAVAELQKAVDLVPESTSLTLSLMNSYVRLQDYESARVYCEKAVDRRPDDPSLWVALGLIHQQLEQHKEAANALQRAIALEPDGILGYRALLTAVQSANDLIAVNDFTTAIDIYSKLVEFRPDVAELRYQLGLNLARINDTQGARQSLERALELNPALAPARYLLGVIYLELKENERAVEAFQNFLRRVPNDVSGAENLAAALGRTGNYAEALQTLLGLIQQDKAEPRHHIGRLYLLLRSGRYEEAGILAPPDEAPLLGTLLRALARAHFGEHHRVMLDSLDTIEGDVDAEFQKYMADLLFLFDEADAGGFFVSEFSALRAEGIRSRVLDTILARVLMILERYDEAEALLLAADETFGSDKWLHYYLATIYEERDRIPETEKHLKACLALDPDDPDVMNFLGYMYAEENMKLDEAEALINRALAIEPENGAYLDSLGWVYYRKGDAGQAITLIRKAILKMNSDDAILRDHLGDAYLLKGDTEKAIAEWERARRLDPVLEGVQVKIDLRRTQRAK